MTNGPGVDTMLTMLADWVAQGGIEQLVVCIRRDDGDVSAMATLNSDNEDEILELAFFGAGIIEDVIKPPDSTLQ